MYIGTSENVQISNTYKYIQNVSAPKLETIYFLFLFSRKINRFIQIHNNILYLRIIIIINP